MHLYPYHYVTSLHALLFQFNYFGLTFAQALSAQLSHPLKAKLSGESSCDDNGAPPWGANGLNIFAHRLQSPGNRLRLHPRVTYLSRRNDEKKTNADRDVSITLDMAISSRRIVMLQSLVVILSHCALN